MTLILLYVFGYLLALLPVLAKVFFTDAVDAFGRRYYKDPRKADLFTGTIIFACVILGFLIIVLCYFAN